MNGQWSLGAVVAAVVGGATAGPLVAQQPLVTDRPDATESAQVMPAGEAQLELGLTAERRSDATIEALLRLGLGGRVEARIGRPAPGFGALGVKLNLFDRGATQFALLAGDEIALTDQSVGMTPSLRGVVSHEWGPWMVAAMSSLVRDPSAGRLVVEQTATVGVTITSAVGGFIEYTGAYPRGAVGHGAHTGLMWLVSPDLQFDVHGGVPLGGVGERFVGVGVALRIR
jgi:hypothetical protein